MFYTKYRPQKFEDLIGLESVAKSLQEQIRKGKLGHAFLFSGPRGTGKTSAARILAKAINCESLEARGKRLEETGPKQLPEPCGKCDSCKAIESGRFLDLIEIDAASNRGIDDVRALRDKINLAPTKKGAMKVYIVDEVHMMTREAFNALLKTLEEPPKHAIFILCTTEPKKIPETIRSRCERFPFKRASDAGLAKKLSKIVKEEKAEVSESDLKKLARASAGGFRDAETMLEQVIVGGLSIEEVLGSGGDVAASDFIDLLLAKDIKAAIIFVNRLFGEGKDLAVFCSDILDYLRDLLLVKAGVGEELVETTQDQYEKIKDQSAKIKDIDEWIEIFLEAQEELKTAGIPQLPLELAIIQIKDQRSQPKAGPPLAEKIKNGDQGGADIATCDTLDVTRNELRNPPTPDLPFDWDKFLSEVKPYNHSLHAVLRSCHLGSFDGNELCIATPYKFHQDRLKAVGNRKILGEVLQKIYSAPVLVKVILEEKAAGEVVEKPAIEKPKVAKEEALKDFNGEI